MEEQSKIDTKIRSVRFPVDVIEVLERWAEETGQSVTQVLSTCVRTAAEDEKRVTAGGKTAESVLHEGEIGAGVLQVRIPKDRDELADAITVLMSETRERISERGQISALGVARARVYKGTEEYQAASEMRRRKGMPISVYENERALGDRLAEDDAA